MLDVYDWPATSVADRNQGHPAFPTDGLLKCTRVLTVGFLKAGLWCTKQSLRLQIRNEHRSRQETSSCFQANRPWSNSNPKRKLESTSTVMSHFKITRRNIWHKESTEPNDIMKASRIGMKVLCKARLCTSLCLTLPVIPPPWLPVNLLTKDYSPKPKSRSTYHPHD